MNLSDLQMYAKEIKSLSPNYSSICKTFLQPNFFFTYLLIRLTVFCPKPHLRQQLFSESTSADKFDSLRAFMMAWAYLDGLQKIRGQLVNLFLIWFQTRDIVAIQIQLPLSVLKEQYSFSLLSLFISSQVIIELTNLKHHCMEDRGHTFGQKRKLTLEKEEAVDPLFHLFTEIPLTSIERKPDLFFQNNSDFKRSQQSPSLRSNRSLNQSSSLDSFQPLNPPRRRPSYQQRPRSGRKNRMKQVLLSLRIDQLKSNFVQKIMRNNIYSKPVTEKEVRLGHQEKRKGWEISEELKMLWGLLVSIIVVFLGVSQSLVLAFPQLQEEDSIKAMVILGITMMMGELCFGLLIIRRQRGKDLQNLSDIFKAYLQGSLPLDGALIIVLIVMLILQNSVLSCILLVLLFLKLIEIPAKLRPVDNKILRLPKIGKAWPYIKLIMLNLLIAHTIGILLNWIALSKGTEGNWQITKGIADAWWFERYVWGFYWSVAMMTTVGFGDIAPVSYTEALWVIFIEIACCLLLVYNLTRIFQLLPMFNKKGSEMGTFEGFAESAQIGEGLKRKVMNYLQQKEDVDGQFNVQTQNMMIKDLPLELKKQFQQQFVQRSISNLPYFKQLHPKTISRLAQCLERKLYLPGQMIKPYDDLLDVYILEKGEVGYICRSNYSKLNNFTVNSVQTGPSDRTSLLSLDFITRERAKYEIRSTTSSIIIKIPYDSFKNALPACQKDFEFYCSLRDRSKHVVDEFQLIPCRNCRSKHTKMACPKLHFIPFRQMVIAHHLRSFDGQNIRNIISNSRLMRRKMNTLNIGKFCREEYAKGKAQKLQRDEARKATAVILKRSSSSLDAVSNNNLQKLFQPSSSESEWASLLSLQLSNQLREQRMQDGVWLLSSDKIHDYREYFPEGNLSAVVRRMSLVSQGRRESEM